MKLPNFLFVIIVLGMFSTEALVASEIFNNLFHLRKNLDSICGEKKWLIQYSISENNIDITGYSKNEGRILVASGALNPGMKILGNIEIESFSTLKVTISDANGLVKSADIIGGECNSVFLTYDYYSNVLRKLTNYHFESKIEKCPNKYILIDVDPEIVMIADQIEPIIPDSHKHLRDRKPPILGFGYDINENGRLVIGDVFEGGVAEHAGLEAADIVTQIFLDYELVDPKNFKAVISKGNHSLLSVVVVREEKLKVIDMFFPTPLERRIMVVPPNNEK